MHLNLLQLGRIPYTEGLRIQSEVVAARKANLIADTLILLEHPSVLTPRPHASRANILASDELLASPRRRNPRDQPRRRRHLPPVPGQLVGLPHLRPPRRPPRQARPPPSVPSTSSASWKKPSSSPAKTSASPTQRICKLTGVWDARRRLRPRKKDRRHRRPCLAGRHLPRLRPQCHHGSARLRTGSSPAGITDRAVTSLEIESPHTPPPSISEASNNVAANFGRVFQRQIMATESLDQLLSTQSTSV